MYKILCLAFNFFIFPLLLRAQNFSIIGEDIVGPLPSGYSLAIIDEQRARFEWTSEADKSYDKIEHFNYSLEQRDGMTFLVLDGDIPEDILLAIFNNAKPWKIGSEILLLLGQIQEQEKRFLTGSYYYPSFFLGYVANPSSGGSHILLEDIHLSEMLARSYRDASSTLSEFGRTYDVNGLDRLESESAWVEGASGDGIGEGFVIDNSWVGTWNSLLIINGFISARNPKLYKENGRVKKIKVEGLKSGVSKVLDVLDTPHPQTVDISFLTGTEKIRVTIADVYPGTKYEDTAIHYCITYDHTIVPLFP